jgi:hypothetical protein
MTTLKLAGLGLHFFLELAAFAALAIWGFQTHSAWWQKLVFGIGLPILAMVLWGFFRVPNDPGNAPVAIPGTLRLLLELAVMASAALALFASGHTTLAWIFSAAVVVDYLIMFERVTRLLKTP